MGNDDWAVVTDDTCKEPVTKSSEDGSGVSGLYPYSHWVTVICVHLLLFRAQNASMQGESRLNQCDSHTVLAFSFHD